MDARREVINEKHRNDDLLRAVKKVEIEKHLVENAADRELDHAKYEIQRSRDELNSLDSVVQQLEVEKRNLINDLKCMQDTLDSKNNEINNLHELVEKIQDDKSKLSKKISKLLENEKELVTELDTLKSSKRGLSTQNRANNGKSLTAKLDAHIKNIEHERDFHRQEVETLQKLLKAAQHDFHLRNFPG
jgi:chromosome segregation ATPase